MRKDMLKMQTDVLVKDEALYEGKIALQKEEAKACAKDERGLARHARAPRARAPRALPLEFALTRRSALFAPVRYGRTRRTSTRCAKSSLRCGSPRRTR